MEEQIVRYFSVKKKIQWIILSQVTPKQKSLLNRIYAWGSAESIFKSREDSRCFLRIFIAGILECIGVFVLAVCRTRFTKVLEQIWHLLSTHSLWWDLQPLSVPSYFLQGLWCLFALLMSSKTEWVLLKPQGHAMIHSHFSAMARLWYPLPLMQCCVQL